MSILNRSATRGSIVSLLGAFALLAASPVAAQIVATPVPGDPVSIDSGAVSGKVLPSNVKAYFGIPFAAPPLGDLRWRAPQKVDAWQGVYHADRLATRMHPGAAPAQSQSLFRRGGDQRELPLSEHLGERGCQARRKAAGRGLDLWRRLHARLQRHGDV